MDNDIRDYVRQVDTQDYSNTCVHCGAPIGTGMLCADCPPEPETYTLTVKVDSTNIELLRQLDTTLTGIAALFKDVTVGSNIGLPD